jgi:hypothetical protein
MLIRFRFVALSVGIEALAASGTLHGDMKYVTIISLCQVRREGQILRGE